MDNRTAVRSLCNAMCNTYYPDAATIDLALFNEGISAEMDATPKDAQLFRVALALVMGYVEGSRSEGGISSSVRSEEALRQSICYWCGIYGLDADEELRDYVRSIEDGSYLW